MSDFFMPTQNNVDQETEKYRNAVNSVQNQEIEDYKQKKQQHLENWDRYGVNVPDEYYDAFNKIIAQAPTPEEAQEEAYKIGSAVKYSEAMGIPLLEAYQNVDAFNEAQFTDLQGQKGRFEALSDMLNLGRNNVKLGRLGQELMQAHINNDTELANSLMAEIDAINQQNQLMQDNAPRSWVMQALEAGAQSLPFTGVVAGAGIIGNFIAPAAGTAASFAASSYLSAGTEYIDMIANGASPETARLVATVSGGIQGLIEADLGISKSIVKSTARVIGKEAAENAAKKSVEEIGRKVFKRFHFGAGKKVLINYLENRGKDILGEGTEEFLQEITSIVGQEVAASLDGYDIPDDDFKSIVKQTAEAFRGGVLGALSMGFIPAGINAAADVREYKLIKDTAEVFESEEMFKNVAKDSPVFEGMSDEAKSETIHEVWQRAQNRKEEEANLEAQKIAEGRDAAEGAEEEPAENEDGTTEANPVARDERGRLYTSDDVSTDDAGNVTGGTFAVGDKTKSENNRYGYIKYSQDAEGNITIQDFKMTNVREGLRAEAYDEFAREHPDVNIEWNPKAGEWEDAKQELIDANPSGKKNGLNYYSTADLDNIQARKRVAEELRKNIHNVKRNADGSYTQTELSNKQIAAGITLIESAARRMNMGLNEYVNKTFGNQIFGSREEFAQASLAQGEDVNTKAGGMYQGVAQANWREVGQQIKAVIYAGEHADFSTWAHEMAHVFQNQLDGQLKADAEAAFNVQGGDWINSTYTFKDGRTMSSAEAFAYGFQDWLETGKAENEQMRNIFQKFAEFIADCYNRLKKHLDFTPEIESVFNQLLDGDDTIMSKALKAAQEQDNEYRASLKRQAEEKQAAKEAEKEEAKKQAEAEREEASEGTDFGEETSEESSEEIERKLDEAINETEETDNAIDNALENTNLTDEQKEQIAETLKDESSTIVEKAEAVTEAAESAYDDEAPIDLFQTEGGQRLLSQLAGEPSIRRMAESEERERILTELDAAQLLDEKYKSMDANSRAARIRRATGWEKDASGQWKYELDDSVNRIKTEFFKANPGVLSGIPYLLNLGDILEADELYKVFPYMKNVRVSFYSDPNAFRAVLTPQGIKVNTRYLQGMNGETGLKGVLAHEIQHIIQAMEFADSKGLQGADIEQLYNDVMKAMQAAGERKYNYDLTSLQQGLDAYMQDAGEIEARNVARRIMMNADQRRMNTLASTEDVKRGGLLFQEVAGAGEAINKDNYFKNTYAQWKSASEKDLPKETPDYESDSGSEYWYTDKGVYRRSNHWGKVASCYWYLNDEVKQTGTTKEIGYTDFSDIQKMEYADDREREIARIRRINYTKYIEDPEAATQSYLDLLKKSAAERLENAEKNNNAFGAEQAKQDIELYDSINLEDVKNFKVPEWDSEKERTRLLFQEVYHGSPHNFENFSTENIGTGEGAQAFGWGLYFTNQESIARFYADKLANEPKRISLISKNEYLKSRKKSLKDVENKEKYETRIIKNINHFKKELKQAQKAGDESEIKFYEGLIDDSYKQLDENERLSLVEAFKKDIANAEQEIKELKASMKNNRNLYTVEIPDDGYLQWDKNISIENIEGIKTALKDRGITDFSRLDNLMENQEKWKDNPNSTYTFGSNIYKVISDYLGGDKNASLFLKDLGYIGIDYPANTIAGKSVEGERNYVIFDEANVNIKNHLLYQNVYHGSGADFDKFDTENFGLSGEGSMSFGYGTYVTDSEDIARDYADRQVSQKYQNVDDPYNVLKTNIIATIIHDTEIKGFEKALKERIEFLQKRIENSQGLYTEEQVENSKKVLDEIKNYTEEDLKKRRLYTVEIPDDGYLEWDKKAGVRNVRKIAKALEEKNKNITYWLPNHIKDLPMEDKLLYTINNQSKTGKGTNEDLYEALSIILGNEKEASKFLHSLGYAGIKYPAGTIHGNGNGAYNYVIFNDEDAQIVDKLLFQTQAELMDEARGFDSWQDFMDYCETFHADDDVSPIPSDNDAQWYQSFWEQAKSVQTEQEKNEEAVEAKNKKDGMLPGAVDALFTTMIRSDPQMVDSFLQAVADIDAIDLDSEEWQQAESAEDAAQRDKIDKLKDFIEITLSDYNWQTALSRIQGGHEIAEGLRKRLIGEITDNFKVRDFRALYAEVMNDEQFTVAEEDSITAVLNKKLKKHHDIVMPNDDISRWSPERRKQLAEQLANREIAAKIKNGSLKLDDELDAYIKSLNKQIKEKQKQFDELEAETKADYQRIADKERRDLLKLHEQLLLARGKLNSRNTEINRKIAKGLKITDKYSRLTQNLNANYDEIFRKYNDLRNSITINAEVQAALERQEQIAGLREDLNAKQKERNNVAEVKKMRIQLVKRAMRRVPFNRVDYNNARTVIAIQRMLEPNLLGGVNRFIGIDSPYLRGVISQIVTDSDYKEKILNYLSKNAKASQAFADFKKKLTELKSIKDFDSWTAKDRKNAIKYLPKENWVRDLKLKELAKEREESIDLDIGMEEVKRTVYDEKTGEPKTYKDAEGNEHNVTETAFRLKYDEELGRLVQDAVGADMFDKIVNLPFSEWTTEDLEALAQRIDELYTEGRDLKAAKDEARKKEAAAIRKRIEDAVKETGITINDDDPPEEKERKQKLIDKELGMSRDIKGTEAGKPKGLKARLNRLLHSYADMNVLRFARMLDGQSEGENVRMLYRKEDDCYNAKQRSMNSRAEKIYKVMKENNITEGDLAEVVKVPSLGTEFTVDELLYFLAADKDYVEDESKLQKGETGLDANDDYAATSRNAVMFGNMMSDMMSQEEKESWLKLDKDMQEALQNDTLTQEQKEQQATGTLDKKPGTTRYIRECHNKWGAVLAVANDYLSTHPEFKALMEAIEADYAEQYDRMNEVSINEFNMPVHRVKAYVPLVRRESNGDTNEAQVKEDLLGAAGVGKQWADRGMTQRRVQISPLNQKPVQTGLFRTWGDSIERTEHFIAYAPYVRQLNAVYKSRDAAYMRRFIESRYGDGAIKYLDEYINEVANPNAGRIRERGAEWLHVLRGKTAPAYLGWKASAIIKQGLTSPWPYMQFVNPAEYFSAAMKFTFNPQMREAIKEKSVYMKMRRMDPVNDLIDEMADNAKTKLDRGWSNFSKLGMQGLELIDWACVAPGWLACYEKKYNQLQNASNARYEAKMAELKERNMYADVGTSEYLTPEQMEAEARKEIAEDIETEAVRYADDCTRACQPSNRVTDLAPMFKNSSEFKKAFLQFQTSLNVIWQNLRYDMPYAAKNKEFTRIAGTVIGYVCAGIFMNSVMEGIGGDDDDDDTQALRNLLYYSTTQFTDAIPIMGSEITNTVDQLITGKRGFASSGTDMTPSATKLLSVLTTAKKGNWQKAAELTAEGIGLYLGAPVSGAKEINKLLGKPLKEGDVNLKRGISDVYGIAGDILEE